MLGCVLPRIVAVLGVAGVLGLAVLPTEHMHRGLVHDGHHWDTIHRHFESHHPIGTRTAVDYADDDGNIQWITVSYTRPESGTRADPDSHLLDDRLPLPTSQLILQRTLQPLQTSVHDPPWFSSCGLRAPPALPSDLI
jgi:hypothetical protein